MALVKPSIYTQDFTRQITSSPAFVRKPEGAGCIERFVCTLMEELARVGDFAALMSSLLHCPSPRAGGRWPSVRGRSTWASRFALQAGAGGKPGFDDAILLPSATRGSGRGHELPQIAAGLRCLSLAGTGTNTGSPDNFASAARHGRGGRRLASWLPDGKDVVDCPENPRFFTQIGTATRDKQSVL